MKRTQKIALCVGLMVALLMGFLYSLSRLPWRADFSRQHPEEVYQMVLGKIPAAGVSDIHCSGRHYFIKRWAWLRFQATDHAMHEIIPLGTPIAASDISMIMNSIGIKSMGYADEDMKRVQWNDVAQIVDPVAYEFYTGSTATWLWHGVMILDRTHHTIFIQAIGD